MPFLRKGLSDRLSRMPAVLLPDINDRHHQILLESPPGTIVMHEPVPVLGKCGECGTRATEVVFDVREAWSPLPAGTLKEPAGVRLGCHNHPVGSYYEIRLDGTKVRVQVR